MTGGEKHSLVEPNWQYTQMETLRVCTGGPLMIKHQQFSMSLLFLHYKRQSAWNEDRENINWVQPRLHFEYTDLILRRLKLRIYEVWSALKAKTLWFNIDYIDSINIIRYNWILMITENTAPRLKSKKCGYLKENFSGFYREIHNKSLVQNKK